MTEPYTPYTERQAQEFARVAEATNKPHLAATLRAYASLLTREAKMREALEEIADCECRQQDCNEACVRIARRALEETK